MVNIKQCRRCKSYFLNLNDFFMKVPSYRDGLSTLCKYCKREIRKPRESVYYHNKKINKTERQRQADKERVLRWRLNNYDRYLSQSRNWEKNNRLRANLRSKEYARKNIPIKLRRIISSHIVKQIREQKNSRKWEEILGYTFKDLICHLEKQFVDGMSWGNHSRHGWHIDHIIPVSSFKINSPDDPEFKKCWALENLQPLWAKDNLTKGARIMQT